MLVRHGRTALTESGRMSGRDGALDPDLSAAGRADAGAVAELLAGAGRAAGWPGTIPTPQAVLASPLRRTRQSAQLVADRLGLPVSVAPGWAEIAFGEWDGLTVTEVLDRWPELLAAWRGSTSVRPPGGESLQEFTERLTAALADTVREHSGRTLVVLTHATPVRAVVAAALQAAPAALWRLQVQPASVTICRWWPDGGAEVVTVNATGHLPP